MELKEKTIKVEDEIDHLFKDRPVELKKIRDNQKFIKKIEKEPLPPDIASIPVFGTSVDFNAILKDNIWDRSVYAFDMYCDMFLGMTVETMMKYRKKKRKLPMNMIWLLLILMFVGVGIIILILFLKGGGLGGII